MKKTFLFAGLLLLVGVGCQNTKQDTTAQIPVETDTKVYCSSSGELVRNPVLQSHRNYCLQTKNTEHEMNVPEDYSFSLIDDRGEKLKDLQIVHEKIMHVIVVREDLNEFRHIHPEFDSETGIFTLKDLTFTSEGPYKIYFDFTPKGAQISAAGNPLGITLVENITIGNENKNTIPNLSNTNKIQTVDKFKITMNQTVAINKIPKTQTPEKLLSGKESKLNFQIEAIDGTPIDHVDKYLGEFGHLVIIKEGTYEYIHAHPPAKSLTSTYNQVPFFVSFPEAGKYKMFFEFKYGGKVYMTDFVADVSQGENTPTMGHQERMTH